MKDPAKLIFMAAIALLLASIGFLTLVPKPSSSGLAAKLRRDKLDLAEKAKNAHTQSQLSNGDVAKQTWTGDSQQIPPIALDKLSKLALSRGLKLVAFRPQRPNEGGLFTQLPFLLTVDGPYPKVVQFAADIDHGNYRLAVNMVQIASSDAASNDVTASIGLIAYLDNHKKEATLGGS
jgi:Tfp pilus assembly protein PilO